jgi:hypothetical protein
VTWVYVLHRDLPSALRGMDALVARRRWQMAAIATGESEGIPRLRPDDPGMYWPSAMLPRARALVS